MSMSSGLIMLSVQKLTSSAFECTKVGTAIRNMFNIVEQTNSLHTYYDILLM